MTPDNPTFPVLALSRDGSIVPYESAAVLSSCNARARWVNRYYDALLVIDAEEHAWRVEGVEVLQLTGASGRLLARLTNGSLRVGLACRREPDQDGMEHARPTVADWLGRDLAFWEASADIDEWVYRARQCRTMDELLSVFR